MIWECGNCSQPESRQLVIDAACHHCGTPLCREDQYLLRDSAFSGFIASHDRRAVHCKPCRDEYHPVPIRLGGSANG
jgi:hypothetical protein